MSLSHASKGLLVCMVVLVICGCCFFGEKSIQEYSARVKTSSPIEGVELLLELDKAVFQRDESVEGRVCFVNRRSTHVTINSRFSAALKEHPRRQREIYFAVYKDGKEFPLIFYTRHDMDPVRKKHFMHLGPGDAHTVHICIMGPIPLPLEKGRYKAYAVYENYYGPEFGFPSALMGTVRSNAVEFTVK